MNKLKITQVSMLDIGGGGEKIARSLFEGYRRKGLSSRLLVGKKFSSDPDIQAIDHDQYRSFWAKLFLASRAVQNLGIGRLRSFIHHVAEPGRFWRIRCGWEDFEFPASHRLLDILGERPSVLHFHNLHGGYFDLRALAPLSQRVPVFLTLHDAWLLSGHCAHSFGCERWKTGCGNCPDLTLYPGIRRDLTAENWNRKREIYAASRLYLATPSQWLMGMVRESMLNSGIVDSRVIPNGVDLSVFCPRDRAEARRALGIPIEEKAMLFVANGIRQNGFKDFITMRDAVLEVARRLPGTKLNFLALGDDAPSEYFKGANVIFFPFERRPERVALFYQAADLYLHAARADTFPNVVLEALACGTPVVATAVGGIPEQIKSLGSATCEKLSSEIARYRQDEATGVLVPPKDPEQMAETMIKLLKSEELLRKLGNNAQEDAVARFGLDRQIDRYLEWYGEILASVKHGAC